MSSGFDVDCLRRVYRGRAAKIGWIKRFVHSITRGNIASVQIRSPNPAPGLDVVFPGRHIPQSIRALIVGSHGSIGLDPPLAVDNLSAYRDDTYARHRLPFFVKHSPGYDAQRNKAHL